MDDECKLYRSSAIYVCILYYTLISYSIGEGAYTVPRNLLKIFAIRKIVHRFCTRLQDFAYLRDPDKIVRQFFMIFQNLVCPAHSVVGCSNILCWSNSVDDECKPCRRSTIRLYPCYILISHPTWKGVYTALLRLSFARASLGKKEIPNFCYPGRLVEEASRESCWTRGQPRLCRTHELDKLCSVYKYVAANRTYFTKLSSVRNNY